jgi:hypothetical protein
VIEQGQRSFRSQVSYVNLVGVLIGSALMIVIFNSRLGAVVCAVVGVVWVGVTLRSVIEVTDDGFTVRGLFHTRHLKWSEADAFVVVGFGGTNRSLLRSGADYVAPAADVSGVVGLSLDAIDADAVAERAPILSAVAVVTTHGERFRVLGTAATPIDPSFPVEAAAELNRRLEQRNLRLTERLDQIPMARALTSSA